MNWKKLKHLDDVIHFFGEDTSWYENHDRVVFFEKFESDKYKIFVNSDEQIQYMLFKDKNDDAHRSNGNPSYVSKEAVMWHSHGKIHRGKGKPAIIRKNVTYNHMSEPAEEYFVNGLRHRENDLPASIYKTEIPHLLWYDNGTLHRENDKPAIINGNFHYFYKNGIIYKSIITYDNKFANWIYNNTLKVFAAIFILIMLIFSI